MVTCATATHWSGCHHASVGHTQYAYVFKQNLCVWSYMYIANFLLHVYNAIYIYMYGYHLGKYAHAHNITYTHAYNLYTSKCICEGKRDTTCTVRTSPPQSWTAKSAVSISIELETVNEIAFLPAIMGICLAGWWFKAYLEIRIPGSWWHAPWF